VSFIKTGFSAIGKLFIVMALAGAFLVGLFGVVYLSLRGEEIQVPEIVGKNREEAEKELTSLGLKMKKRADRYSQEKPNTILEQSPKAGTTAKTGQQILVVVSQVNPESTEAPATVEKDDEDSATTEPGTDKPQKTKNTNANIKKPTQTSRDVNSNKAANKNSNANVSAGEGSNSAKSNSSASPTSPANKATTTTPPANKSTTTPANTPKPAATKTPTSGDTRSRKVPN
jgi:beta-lactam-binding protein with PASTA domain